MNKKVQLIECPRDAIQGIKKIIPTNQKIDYINYLLSLNIFDTIDFGSFVSHKLIPQMADTQAVINGLINTKTNTKLLCIVANLRGAEQAVENDKITYLGYPFSISETFQLKNTNSTRNQALVIVENMNILCQKNSKDLVVYLSMAFGNPYHDELNADIVIYWVEKLRNLGIKKISLADTIGIATEKTLLEIGEVIFKNFTDIDLGLHLHTRQKSWKTKIDIASNIGFTRFDGTILGYGGCPMAQDELVGNMPMENLLEYFKVANEKIIADLKENFTKLIS